MKISLKSIILISFLSIILFLSLSIGALGVHSIKKNIIKRAQDQVKYDLTAAETIFFQEVDDIKSMFNLVSDWNDLDSLKKKMNLDYLYKVKLSKMQKAPSIVLSKTIENKDIEGGLRIVPYEELISMDNRLYERSRIEIRYTPKARPLSMEVVESAMVIECAKLLYDNGKESGYVACGGRIINRDFNMVDKIRDLVFESENYSVDTQGTVTIFQDDVRITTNVFDENNKRAIGTRVSEVVYDTVIKQEKSWIDRAFVVTSWYLTAYKPIKDINGNVIGMLYVGISEKPFTDIMRDTLFLFLGIVACAGIIALILAFFLSSAITRPVTDVVLAASRLSEGKLDHRAGINNPVSELRTLAFSFNHMAQKLGENHNNIKLSNEKLSILNKKYIDLISFVSHELKGILSSTILNAYSVRDGFLGMVNFKQQKALNSITRNLDHLSETVKNFLSLSRIEKNEMKINEENLYLKEDIFDISMETFAKQISDSNMSIISNIDKNIKVRGDRALILVVANNLINNAIKYGNKNSKIILNAKVAAENKIEIAIYNDSRPLTKHEIDKLFKRFSRLPTKENKITKGTGLGLFITKEIINSHNENIRIQPESCGNSFIFTLKKGD